MIVFHTNYVRHTMYVCITKLQTHIFVFFNVHLSKCECATFYVYISHSLCGCIHVSMIMAYT